MGPRFAFNDEPVLWLRVGTGKVSTFLTLLVVVCFCNCEDFAELIFDSVNGLWGDHAVEACQFVAEGGQRVAGCISFGGCHFCTASLVVGAFWL